MGNDSDAQLLRRCSKCSERLPLANFGRDRQTADGLNRYCKECRRAMSKTYAKSHRAEATDRMRAWRAANPERARAAEREWAKANPEKVRSRKRRYRDANPDAARAYYEANRAAVLARTKANRDADPTKHSALVKRWNTENPLKRRDIGLRRRARELAAQVGPVDLDALWNGTCGICGEPLDQALRHPDPLSKSVDHIVPLAHGGLHSQANLQWAHLVCNIRKGAKTA